MRCNLPIRHCSYRAQWLYSTLGRKRVVGGWRLQFFRSTEGYLGRKPRNGLGASEKQQTPAALRRIGSSPTIRKLAQPFVSIQVRIAARGPRPAHPSSRRIAAETGGGRSARQAGVGGGGLDERSACRHNLSATAGRAKDRHQELVALGSRTAESRVTTFAVSVSRSCSSVARKCRAAHLSAYYLARVASVRRTSNRQPHRVIQPPREARAAAKGAAQQSLAPVAAPAINRR
jgi:hypothetical protein